MPCPIQIRETIQKSIDRKLPDPQAVMSQDAAKGIVDYLNKLWSSAITRMQQYSGLGGFRVVVNSLDDAVNKEFKRQQDAEKSFERDLDFFKGDEALMEQEQRDLFLQKSPTAVKPGVQELFDSNPELVNVGTPQQYSQYLDSIFPNSKVKGLVYRGSENGIEQETNPWLYFSNSINDAYMYAKANVSKGGKITERNPIPTIIKNIAKKYNLSKNVLWGITDTQIGVDGLVAEEFISPEEGNIAKELLNTNPDIRNLARLIELYPFVKIESEQVLMKQFDG